MTEREEKSSRITILVVDDDPAIRRLIIASLRRDGYNFQEAGTGAGALDIMRRQSVQLVILDLMMPEVNGWDVLLTRSSDDALLQIPVIVISANREPEVAEAMRHNLHGFLPKPFELTALQALVRRAIAPLLQDAAALR